MLGSRLAADVCVVLTKELRGSTRGWRPFAVLTAYLCFLSPPLLIAYVVAINAEVYQRFSAGRMVFLPTVGIELALVCLIAPALAAGAIAGERERQTYDLLVATPLSSLAIVVGKLLAAVAYLLLLAVAALPLQSVALWLGGVAPVEVAIGLVLVAVTALAYAAIGLFLSALARSTLLASVLSYVAIVLLAGGPPFLLGAMVFVASRFGRTAPAWLSEPAPWFVFLGGAALSVNPATAGAVSELALVAGRPPFVFWENFGSARLLVVSPWLVFTLLHLCLAGLLVVVAARRLHRETRKSGSREEGKR